MNAPRTGVVILVAAVLFVVALVLVLSQSAPRLAATNTRVLASEKVVGIRPGGIACTPGEYIPREAAYLRVYAGPDAPRGPELKLTARRVYRSDLAFEVRVPGGYAAGPLDIDLPPRRTDLEFTRVCIRNLGQDRVAFGGNYDPVSPEAPPSLNGPFKDSRDYVRMDWMRPGAENWIELAPTVAERYSLLKPAWLAPWTMYLAILAMIGAAVGAIRIGLRAVREP